MAWTTPRTWVASEVPDETIMNAHIRDNLAYTFHSIAHKTADETVNNSTALQDDAELSITVGASEVWYIHTLLLHYTASGAAVGLKTAYTWPSGTAVFGAVIGDPSTGEADTMEMITSGVADAGGAAKTGMEDIVLEIHGVLRTGGTGGTLRLQWAQNTATAVDTIVRAGSRLAGVKLA